MRATERTPVTGTKPAAIDQPPAPNAEAEKALVGAILAKPDLIAEAAGIVRPSDFHDHLAQTVYREMLALHQQDKPVDVALLLPRIKTALDPHDADQAAGCVAALYDRPPVAAHWRAYIDAILESSRKRRAHHVLVDALGHVQNGQPAAELLRNTIRDLDAIMDSGAPDTFSRITTRELLTNSPRPTYLIEGVLVDGQPMLVGGTFKSLKTTIACDLAVSLATGGHFLGYFKVPQAVRVGMMSGESGHHTLAETTTRIAWAAGVNPLEALDNLIWFEPLPRLTDATQIDALRHTIKSDELAAIIIDPLYLALSDAGKDASNMFSMGAAFRPLAELGAETGCTIILVHHTSRGATRDRGFMPPELGDLSFSGTAEFCRQWLLLGRRSLYGPGTGHHELWLTVGGSAGHSGLWAVDVDEGQQDADFSGRSWSVSVRNAEAARTDAEAARLAAQKIVQDAVRDRVLDEDRQAIVHVMTKLREPQTKTTIRDAANLRTERFGRAFGSLLLDMTVEKVVVTKGNNRAYDAFQINPKSEAD